MRRIFADAVYWVALAIAKTMARQSRSNVLGSLGRCSLVTTDDVLSEFLAYYSGHGPALRSLRAAPSKKPWPTRLDREATFPADVS